MLKPIPITLNLIILFVLLFTNCTKDEGDTNTGDPSNLSVVVLSVNSETMEVELQAIATNTINYQLYVNTQTSLVEENTDGFFRYKFSAYGNYTMDIRAYGSSGRYIKETVNVSVTDGITNPGEIPLDSGYITPDEYTDYTLAWADEFNTTSINTSYWNFETGAGGWGNNEWQYYRKENASQEDGTLIIEAKKEVYSGSSYTSARMTTQGKQSFKYGRIDIRALLPKGQGIWPALWMLGNNISSAGWPACGETDIMEMIGGNGRDNTTHGTLHWEYNGDHAQSGGSYKLSTGIFADKYHVFTLIWDETTMVWYVDDKKFYTLDITPSHMTEFHQNFFFIINLAVGGNWPGYPDSSTVFPQFLKVDYVRVFQKN